MFQVFIFLNRVWLGECMDGNLYKLPRVAYKSKEKKVPSFLNPQSDVWCVVVSQGGGWTVWPEASLQGGLQRHLEPGGVAGAAELPDSPLPPGGREQQL